MEDVERLMKVVRQKRLARQRELDDLGAEPGEHRRLMNELRDLRRERERCKENITKHLGMITSHKHAIHKIVHSTQDVAGLPVPHDYAQDMNNMFSDAIEFLNNVGDIQKALANVKEDNEDPSKLIQAVRMCTEAVGNKLYQTKCSITQLETLKENIAALEQHILDNNDNTEDESTSLTINDDSAGSGSTIT